MDGLHDDAEGRSDTSKAHRAGWRAVVGGVAQFKKDIAICTTAQPALVRAVITARGRDGL